MGEAGVIENSRVRGHARGLWRAALLIGVSASVARAAEPELVHARSRTTWIYPAPRVGSHPLGYVRAGHALPRRDRELRRGEGCAAGWSAVMPRGFVCLDDASLEATRYVRALRDTLGAVSPLDFDFALSAGTPSYRRVPTAGEWSLRELAFGAPRRFAASGEASAHDALAGAPFGASSAALPWFLRTNGSARQDTERELVRQVIPAGSTLAYTRRFDAGGRSWLLSTDGSIVPAERVRRFKRTSFHGVELGAKLGLPLFWVRGHGAAQYALQRDGTLRVGGAWAKLSAVALDAAHGSVVRARRRYLKTRETAANGAPLYVLERDATVMSERVTPPVELG
ncbi:MAG TPA: hypothetical protein VEQ59_07960, partial [Polyangiaceae bacterium]|nr:hypothetical protein [Polyangiaceae bacterium]